MVPTSLNHFGVLGDIHAEDVFLERALTYFRDRGLEHVLAVGDLVDGLGDVNRTLDLLQEHEVIAVRGNHERWLMTGEMRSLTNANSVHELRDSCVAYLEQLPTQLHFDTPLGRLLLCHGLGNDDMAEVLPDDQGYALQVNGPLHELIADNSVQWVINGHSHRPMVRRFEDRTGAVTILNAGTLYREHEPRIAEVDLDTRTVMFLMLEDEGLRALEPITIP